MASLKKLFDHTVYSDYAIIIVREMQVHQAAGV